MNDIRSIAPTSAAPPCTSAVAAREATSAPAAPTMGDGYVGSVETGGTVSAGPGGMPSLPAAHGSGNEGVVLPSLGASDGVVRTQPALAPSGADGLVGAFPSMPVRASASSPATLLMEASAPVLALGTPAAARGTAQDLGPGFPPVKDSPRTTAERLHDLLASRVPRLYALGVSEVLSSVSDGINRSLGLDLEGLLSIERRLYQVLAHSEQGYVGSSPPIFQALAAGQAAYVNLGPGREKESDHLTRLFSGLPPETLRALGAGHDELTPVRQALLDRMAVGDFPAYVSVGGDLGTMSATESIATESIASIARRENSVGSDFSDPTQYFRWLVTRVDSAYRKVDPWLSAVDPTAHYQVDAIKTHLTSPWLNGDNHDPFGFTVHEGDVQAAYGKLMGLCGGGAPPTFGDFTRFADSAVSLDRDLMTGIQTYWTKFLRELSRDQLESVLAPLSRVWVGLNVVPPGDAGFEAVSPPYAPDIELIDRHTGRQKTERYDRAMALSEVVDHTLDGLGIHERRHFVAMLKDDIRAQGDAIRGRENRIRGMLGDAYSGLDVEGILAGRVDARDPAVSQAFEELRQSLQPDAETHPMTVQRAEIQRHLDLLKWMASQNFRYGDVAMGVAERAPGISNDPFVVGEYFVPPAPGTPVTPLPVGPSQVEVLGKPVPGQEPLGVSVVLEGGGGKGFAFVECLKQTRAAMREATGQVAIDEYVGNSAGSIMAGLMACGYSPEELATVLPKLDFKKFYSDYLWLMGGVDPKVRGIDRSGLFSEQKMYQTLSRLLADKLGVVGRPVLFRDLPFKLKVTSTVLNTDLPEDMKQQMGIGKDGQIVFSADKTPNMDVAAAICCSAAVPGFFNAPQIQFCRQEPNGEGGEHWAVYRMQLFDGGSVNNFPIAEATRPEKGEACMVALPAYCTAPGAHPGDPPVELSTLDFDQTNLPRVNAFNAGHYQQFAPQVASFVQKARETGVERAVLAYNLTSTKEQPAPIVQGTTREKSKQLGLVAQQVGLPRMSVKKGAQVIRSNFIHQKPGVVQQAAINALLDKDDQFKPGLIRPPEYHPGQREAEGLTDVFLGVTAARMTTPYHLDSKLFEHPSR